MHWRLFAVDLNPANAGAHNHHLVGRGEATVEIEDDRFGHWPVALDFERPVARWQAKRKEQRIERVEWQEKLRLRHVFPQFHEPLIWRFTIKGLSYIL